MNFPRDKDLDLAGEMMFSWMSDLFPINRSLTGSGVRETLQYIEKLLPQIKICEVPTGFKAFDWVVPKEWNIVDAHISDMAGVRIVDFNNSNLHVVGYSQPVNGIFTRDELEVHLHSLPDQPNAIPYVTSYYKEDWGFCLTQNQRDVLGQGPFNVVIESTLKEGLLTYGELKIEGQIKDEILLSTYVCHPSMASNELSGPVIATYLAKFLEKNSPKYSYRFLFLPETIGSLVYLSENLDELRRKVKAGWVLTCLGDDLAYSYLETRYGNTLTDRASRAALDSMGVSWRLYPFLERGSDERQYCSPGIDLPIGSIMRSKYDEYAEYHTSLDNLDFASKQGLAGGLNAIWRAISILERNFTPRVTTLGEPQLGKRGLYPVTSTKESIAKVADFMNVISYSDGSNDALELSVICKLSIEKVFDILEVLNDHRLIEVC